MSTSPVKPSGAAQIVVGAPDAERLLLQSRFVTSQLEAEVLRGLELRVRSARVLDPSEVPPDLVTMNSRVLLRDLENGRQSIFTLVFPPGANTRKRRVSVLTPLGAALLGARPGQRVGSAFVVEAILYQPEAHGDYYG